MVKRQFETITSAFKRVSLSTWFLLVLGTAVLVVLVGWLGSWGLRVVQDWTHLQQNPTEATQKQFNASLEIVKAIVGGIGTLATIVGGIVLYLNFRVANRNAELTESRLITERFSKAVEQLGSDKIEVRLGGIYALERIAQDSVRDHWTIMEVLTAFVREKSPAELREPEHYSIDYGLQPEDETHPDELEAELTPLTSDVQAALTVIVRRETKNDLEGQRIDLSHSSFSTARLIEVSLMDADLFGAVLIYANFTNADLRRADLRRADLSSATLQNANLTDANLTDADLSSAKLLGANFTDADLSSAKLLRTTLYDANLSGAIFHHADLRHANLSHSNLLGAIFKDADLRHADLNYVHGLTHEQLKFAKLCHTTMPDGRISDRDCEALGLPPSNNSASQPEPDSH